MSGSAAGDELAFQFVLDLIVAARGRTERVVNTAVIELYWSAGEYLSLKIDEDGWGKGTVASLSEYIQHRQPGLQDILRRIFGVCGSFMRLTGSNRISQRC